MKITKRQLRRIIKEEMITLAVPVVNGGGGEEVSEVGMSINQLQATASIALELSEQIREMNYVPEWGQTKRLGQ
jgi:glycerate-2-kinase